MKSFEQIEYILEKYAGSSKVRDRVASSARDFLTTRKLSKLRQDKFLKADRLKSKPAQGGKSVQRGIQSVMDKTKSKVQNLIVPQGDINGKNVYWQFVFFPSDASKAQDFMHKNNFTLTEKFKTSILTNKEDNFSKTYNYLFKR